MLTPLVALLLTGLSGDILPVQASASGLGQLGRDGTTFGASLYVGYAHGHLSEERHVLLEAEGFFWGVGVTGTFGATDLAECTGVIRCVGRRSAGLAARIGLAGLDVDGEPPEARFYWPDVYAYVQLGGFFGVEELPSAPLAPGTVSSLRGLRLELGVSSVMFSRWVFQLIGRGIAESKSIQGALVGVLLLPLSLFNHVQLGVEWSNTAISPGGLRVGLALGTSF